MWAYRQYYLGNLISSFYHPDNGRFFMAHGTDTYACSPRMYTQIRKIAETTVMRTLLC